MSYLYAVRLYNTVKDNYMLAVYEKRREAEVGYSGYMSVASKMATELFSDEEIKRDFAQVDNLALALVRNISKEDAKKMAYYAKELATVTRKAKVPDDTTVLCVNHTFAETIR
jgi:hypothetical protein